MADNSRKHKLLFVILVLAAMGIILGVVHTVTSSGRVTTDDAYIDGRIHQIAFKIPGTVLKLRVDDNQDVKIGDLLVELDPADPRLETLLYVGVSRAREHLVVIAPPAVCDRLR